MFTLNNSLAPMYDRTSTYKVDDVVIYNKKMYKCTVDIETAEEFDEKHWTRTYMTSEFNKENSNLSAQIVQSWFTQSSGSYTVTKTGKMLVVAAVSGLANVTGQLTVTLNGAEILSLSKSNGMDYTELEINVSSGDVISISASNVTGGRCNYCVLIQS